MGSIMSIWHWVLLIPQMNVITTYEQLEMPIFAPNEYFWKNFWDGKNEDDKWKVFAEAVRQAMAECGNLTLSDSTQEDKIAYKAIVWGNTFKDD